MILLPEIVPFLLLYPTWLSHYQKWWYTIF